MLLQRRLRKLGSLIRSGSRKMSLRYKMKKPKLNRKRSKSAERGGLTRRKMNPMKKPSRQVKRENIIKNNMKILIKKIKIESQ